MLYRLRALIKEADPEVAEEWKWRGTPVWSHNGLICTGETYKNLVKMTFKQPHIDTCWLVPRAGASSTDKQPCIEGGPGPGGDEPSPKKPSRHKAGSAQRPTGHDTAGSVRKGLSVDELATGAPT